MADKREQEIVREKGEDFVTRLYAEVLRVYNEIRETNECPLWTLQDYRSGDDAPQFVRARLPEEFQGVPLTLIRRGVHAGTNNLKAVKRKKLKGEERKLRRLIKEFPFKGVPDRWHEIHESDEYQSLVRTLKELLDYHCQGCWRVFPGHLLDGHILDYNNWNVDGRILILCHDDCHPVCDALRRRGKYLRDAVEDDLPMDSMWSRQDGNS